jgi:hypothetical protein
MNPIANTRLALLAVLLAAALPAHARVAADQLDRLGRDLTPVGAEKAANKDGSIPAWDGGLAKAPAGFDRSKGWADPFAADKPLFTITAANAEQYKDKLAPGQLALLKRYPGYKLVVYRSHRSAAYPAAVYDSIRKEAGQADTAQDGNAVVNVVASPVPFPIPKSGVEAIWNNAFRYRGGSVSRHVSEFPVQANGAFTPVKRQEEIAFASGMKSPPANLLFYFRTQFNAPSSISGEAILVHDFVDQVKQPRAAWVYNPGSRRVLRAPEVSYDSPRNGVDGLSTTDDYDGYNGSPDRFDWKLVGKKEMIVSYNNYRLTDKSLKYTDIIKPGTMNQDLVRYELHRVWVVEGTLKAGKNHVYGKRVYFLDEDSWQVAHGDLYDGRGELWRVLEQHGVQYYDAPAFWLAGSAQYDLQARHYVASGLTSEEKPIVFNAPLKPADFTTDALRRAGN